MRATDCVSRWRSNVGALWSIIAVISSATLVSACASERIDLLDQGVVQVQAETSQSSEITNVRVLTDPDENQTTVYGKVRRLGVYDNAFSGRRIVVEAIFHDGSVIERMDNILVPVHRTRQFRRIYPEANFKVIFDQILPQGTILRLKFLA